MAEVTSTQHSGGEAFRAAAPTSTPAPRLCPTRADDQDAQTTKVDAPPPHRSRRRRSPEPPLRHPRRPQGRAPLGRRRKSPPPTTISPQVPLAGGTSKARPQQESVVGAPPRPIPQGIWGFPQRTRRGEGEHRLDDAFKKDAAPEGVAVVGPGRQPGEGFRPTMCRNPAVRPSGTDQSTLTACRKPPRHLMPRQVASRPRPSRSRISGAAAPVSSSPTSPLP